MKNLRHKLVEELYAALPVGIYFLILFQLLALTEFLILEQAGSHIYPFLTAAVSAALVTKVVVVADYIRLPKPLPGIYAILIRSTAYFFAATLVRYLEHLVRARLHTDSLHLAHEHLLAHTAWPHFIASELWLAVSLLVYCTCRHLILALGPKHSVELFFHSPKPK